MKTKTRLVAGGIAGVAVAGLALATATTGSFNNFILSTGTADRDIHAHAHVSLPGTEEGFSAELETDGASNFIVQDVSFVPGGTTGWHKHPGVLLLSLTADSGSVDWYDADCHKHVYNAGDSWTEGTKVHDVVNNSSINARFIVTYVVPKGVNKRTDIPASEVPACAAALGLL
jgi:quercetin dioxygenase-like cupin family protein